MLTGSLFCLLRYLDKQERTLCHAGPLSRYPPLSPPLISDIHARSTLCMGTHNERCVMSPLTTCLISRTHPPWTPVEKRHSEKLSARQWSTMMKDICVIGAGAAGLCAARYLTSHPDMFKVRVFEQTSTVGGTWNYTDAVNSDRYGLPIHSSMYKNLRWVEVSELTVSQIVEFFVLVEPTFRVKYLHQLIFCNNGRNGWWPKPLRNAPGVCRLNKRDLWTGLIYASNDSTVLKLVVAPKLY